MGQDWEQSGNKNPKLGQDWEQSGEKVGQDWEQSGNKVDSTAAPALARTILDSVRNDGGHLIAVATSIALALHTGRTDL